MVLKGLLSGFGQEADFAENGEQAVEMVQESEPYDVVFMDCEMPVLNGYDATQIIRQWEVSIARDPVQIVAVSAHVLSENITIFFGGR